MLMKMVLLIINANVYSIFIVNVKLSMVSVQIKKVKLSKIIKNAVIIILAQAEKDVNPNILIAQKCRVINALNAKKHIYV